MRRGARRFGPRKPIGRYIFCRAILWAGMLGVTLFSPGCGPSPPDEAPAPRGNGLNVLLITLDTTRSDRLGCYGYEAAGTPTIDALADRGTLFENAFCQVPLTLPSHCSILSGLNPPSHGVHINGSEVLSPQVETLAERMKAAGYRTGAFIAAWVVDAVFGLSQGFDHYDDLAGSGHDASEQAERPGNEVVDAALTWLETEDDAPFFAWVHLFDPHTPLTPPPPYDELFEHPYDGEIAFADSQVGRLTEWLRQRGVLEKTIILIVGDHGEAFGEHGESSHGYFIYNTTMQVPLIVSCPQEITTPRRIPGVVRSVDVAPTLLELAGLQLTGRFDGTSLASFCRLGEGPELVAYGESEYTNRSFGWAPLYSVTEAVWKYIAAPTPELYDRTNDREEMTNLAADRPESAALLVGLLADQMASMVTIEAESAQMDESARRKLESLGYLGGGGQTVEAAPGETLRDPKEMIAVYSRVIDAKTLIAEERFEEAAALLSEVLPESPDSGEILSTLGEAYLSMGMFPHAQEAFRRSLRHDPGHPFRLSRMAEAMRLQGKLGEALVTLNRLIANVPDYGEAYTRLGWIYTQQNQLEQARDSYLKLIEITPTSALAYSNLGGVLLRMQQFGEAARYLRESARLDPTLAAAHHQLWQTLAADGKLAESQAAVKTALTYLPDDPDLMRRMAWVSATAKDADLRDPALAESLAGKLIELDREDPQGYDILGAAQASAGDFEEAAQSLGRAIHYARAREMTRLVPLLFKRRDLYRNNEPYRE